MMLTEKQLEELLQVFLERAQAINEEYLIAMGDHIREIGELIPSDINRLIQMQRMQANLDAAKKEIARIAEISADDLAKVFVAAAELDARFVAETFNNASRLTIANNAPLQQMLKAQFEETYGAMKNLSQTTIDSGSYRKAVDKGIQAVQAGMEDYNKAIRRVFSEAAENGLRVTYPSGRTMRLDSAVRQNVLDGVRALSNNVLEQAGKEFGADGIEISAHALCAEDHLPYQGKQYSNKAFAELQDKLPRPFGMWNCKHSMHPILLGISEPAYTNDELEQYRKNSTEKITVDGKTMSRYQWTQQQRKIETAVRYQKDAAIAAKASGDKKLQSQYQSNINKLWERYEKISAAAGIKPEYGRMRVEGFTAVKVTNQLKNAAERAKIESEQKHAWLKNGYEKAIKKGDLSALTGFDHYVKVAQEIERELVGTTTTDGIVITGYKTHFIDRIIGSYERRREPVSITHAKDSVLNGTVRQNRPASKKPSNVYSTKHCSISINPDDGILIQATPKESG